MIQRPSRRAFAGFTLIELSIALVVIGLLIGTVLVAANILQSARVTSAVNAMRGFQAAVSTYNENYGVLPGDDRQAVARFSANGVTNNGGGNGVIGVNSPLTRTFDTNVALSDGDGAPESLLVWSHMRAAGLVKGQGSQATPPGNPFGGVYGIQNGAFTTNGFTLGANVLCASNVPGSAARVLDQRLDDGDALAGNVRAGTSVTAATAAYADNNTYILCMAL